MADWASKASYNNPLFTIYHTLQFAKHKGMYWGGKKKKFTDYYGHECENTFGMPLVHHRAELAPAGNVKDGPFSDVFSPRVILRSSACMFCHTGMFCRRVPKNSFRARFVTLFQQHCNKPFLFPRYEYRCA